MKPPRLPLPAPEAMNTAQRDLYDRIIASPTRSMNGPQRANIHSPELAEAWWRLGDTLRNRTVLPPKLAELAIIVVGRRWNSQVEFHVHGAAAVKAGLDVAIVEAIRVAAPPPIQAAEEREVYEFARQIQVKGEPDDAAYAAILARWGERGAVELTALIGFYGMVSVALNAHRIPLPAGAPPALSEAEGFTDLPPA
ncbi:carboxymuconolactone decarboxylase family protein [Roseococcus sp.]|uniref:carboxymuconolactone decarboxylase family protein n=1 Tax=Roseococcus sp. TaxID=2109646 RepID=UPI003BA92E0C